MSGIVISPLTIEVRDEGSIQGQIQSFDFTGAGVSASVSGDVATVNISGAGGGATTALDNLASVAINAALLLGTSDAFALGSGTKMWSDLFLGDGGIINWNNGNATLIHSTGLLTLNVPLVVPDEAYDATGWNGDLSVPTKNAVRDKIESMTGGGITHGQACTLAYLTL